MNKLTMKDFTKMVFENPQGYLESIRNVNEKAALMVAISIDEDPNQPSIMKDAAWQLASEMRVFLHCPHCGHTMFEYKQHESCRRQAVSDEFLSWLEENDK